MTACTIPQTEPVALPQTTTTSATTTPPKTTTTTKPKPTTTTTTPPAEPEWTVGAHRLPVGADGYGEIQPTPAQLRKRSLPTTDHLRPPADGRYHSTIAAIPAQVLARSTWVPGCPVAKSGLRYLTMSFRGFDGKAHTGEMIVNAAVAPKVTTVFGQLFDRRYPIEEMRVTARAELDAPPTGDGNNTASFVCRPIVGQTNWSAHAYGLAVDVNPFINPYRNGDLVLPELASSYLDRSWVRPGMVLPGDGVVRAFAAQGFGWGGYWTRPKDLQHFTANGH
jgi:D-alanyl-D-alanine carboxypeptidase-like protein